MTASPGFALAEPIPLNGQWITLDEFSSTPFFFQGGPWTWMSRNSVRFDITDLFVVSDVYRVFDRGALIATVSGRADWSAIGGACTQPVSSACHWTADPDVAWADPFFNKASLLFGGGSHAITVEDIHRPPSLRDGPPFADGTVAFRASEIAATPEPTTLLMLGASLLVALRRRGPRVNVEHEERKD